MTRAVWGLALILGLCWPLAELRASDTSPNADPSSAASTPLRPLEPCTATGPRCTTDAREPDGAGRSTADPPAYPLPPDLKSPFERHRHAAADRRRAPPSSHGLLRDPFRSRRASSRHPVPDLKDPFRTTMARRSRSQSGSPSRIRSRLPEDLRDPFAPTLDCADSGQIEGNQVPVQRPGAVQQVRRRRCGTTAAREGRPPAPDLRDPFRSG